MKNKELIKSIAHDTSFSESTINIVIRSLTSNITKTIAWWDKVRLIDFWTFDSVRIKSRNWVNPSTWEKIVIPELNRVKFKPSTIIKKLLNK